jgi:hypothetical protein
VLCQRRKFLRNDPPDETVDESTVVVNEDVSVTDDVGPRNLRVLISQFTREPPSSLAMISRLRMMAS